MIDVFLLVATLAVGYGFGRYLRPNPPAECPSCATATEPTRQWRRERNEIADRIAAETSRPRGPSTLSHMVVDDDLEDDDD